MKTNTYDNSPIGTKKGRLKASIAESTDLDINLKDNKSNEGKDFSGHLKKWAEKNPYKSLAVAGLTLYFVGPKRLFNFAKFGVTSGVLGMLMSGLEDSTSNKH